LLGGLGFPVKISEGLSVVFSSASLRLCVRLVLARAQSRKVRFTIVALALTLISLTTFFIYSYRAYAKIVDARLSHGYLISRAGIYAAPQILRPGQKLSPDGLASALRRAGYVESEDAGDVWNGSFSVNGAAVEIRPNNDGYTSVVRITFDPAGRILEIAGDEIGLGSFTLAPASLTSDVLMKGSSRPQLAFKDIPPVLVQAIISIEDRRFFDHHGLDIFGVARAMLRNAGDERLGQGGSTITQQLIKNTYLTPERTLRRKYAEAMLAFTLERRLSKEDIFALYCNEIYLGQRGVVAVRGVDQAAHVFFGKDLKDLSLTEAATIAGMIQSPSRYSPVRHGDAARARRNTVLGTMVRDGFVTLDQAGIAAKEALVIADFDPARESVAPYFIDYVNRVSEARASARAGLEIEGAGNDAGEPQAGMPALHEATVTTLDLDLQRLAAQAVERQLDQLDRVYKPRGLTPQVALVALDPRTGEVLAMIGGRDYGASQLNRVTDAQRQPGSVFKPFVYAAALETGMSPLTMFKDAPQEFTYDRTSKYRPANYGGGFSMRDVTMRTGLIKSLNVVTVDVAMQTGLARVANIAERFGLPRPVPYPSLALGTTEVTPLQMAAGYATFANGGRRIRPRVIASTDPAPLDDQIIQPASAYVITDMLEGVIDHGTARAARGAIKNSAMAGKTGTSRDGWFVGYTPNLVCAVWIGFDDNTQLGLTGAEAALPVWTDFMKSAVDVRPELGGSFFAKPDGVTIVDVDPETEELATGLCPQHERVAIASGQAPSSECFRHSIYFALPNDDLKLEAPAIAKLEVPRSTKKDLSREYAPPRDTRVDVDKRGRSILVNELRVSGR
jgi:penicillin-binding protein 1B